MQPERQGCPKHSGFSLDCMECWYIDNGRLRTALERILRRDGIGDAVYQIAIQALRGFQNDGREDPGEGDEDHGHLQ